jgi:hypothetical protein
MYALRLSVALRPLWPLAQCSPEHRVSHLRHDALICGHQSALTNEYHVPQNNSQDIPLLLLNDFNWQGDAPYLFPRIFPMDTRVKGQRRTSGTTGFKRPCRDLLP